MNLEHELKKELLKLKSKQQKLTIKWNAGGDETIGEFFINEKSIDWLDNDLYYNLYEQ